MIVVPLFLQFSPCLFIRCVAAESAPCGWVQPAWINKVSCVVFAEVRTCA